MIPALFEILQYLTEEVIHAPQIFFFTLIYFVVPLDQLLGMTLSGPPGRTVWIYPTQQSIQQLFYFCS
jgi:hypothetical protein